MFTNYPGRLLALLILLLAGCRSEKAAFYYCRPQVAVASADTAAAPADAQPIAGSRATPAPLALAKPTVAAVFRRSVVWHPRLPKQRLLAAVPGVKTAKLRRRSSLERRPAEMQSLDPPQHWAVTTIIAGAALTVLGLLLITALVNGGGGSLGAAILIVMITYAGFITLAIGLVLLLVATLLKLAYRN